MDNDGHTDREVSIQQVSEEGSVVKLVWQAEPDAASHSQERTGMRSMPWSDADLAQSRTLDSGESPSCFFMLQQVKTLFFMIDVVSVVIVSSYRIEN